MLNYRLPSHSTPGTALKTYRSPQRVVADIKQLIAADKPSPHPPSVLVRILKLLCEARNYERAAIFLVIGGREVPRAVSGSETAANRPELTVSIKIAGRTLGSLRAVPARGHEASSEERVLLREVADLLALYLTGKGKYLTRKAREALLGASAQGSSEARGYQPSSEKPAIESRRAAAGEKYH
jgi:hypothetical protein